MKRLRVLAGVAGVVLASLLPAIGAVLQLASTPELFRPRDDPVSDFERRFARLRGELRSQPIVGYLPPVRLEPTARKAHLYLTRYTLAPTLVRSGLEQPLVVADLIGDPGELPPHFAVRRDFGGGLLLLERVGQ
jgi:hypothetical protein